MFYSYFTRVYAKEVVLHKHIEDADIIVVNAEYKKIYILDRNDIANEFQDTRMTHYTYYRLRKTVFVDNVIKLIPYYHIHSVYPYFVDKTVDEMKQETLRELMWKDTFTTNKYREANLILKLEREGHGFVMAYYVNNTIIENVVNVQREKRIHLLHELASRQIKKKILEDVSIKLKALDACSSPVQSDYFSETQFDNSVLKNGVTLYDYQKRDVQWMKQIESNVSQRKNRISHTFSLHNNLNDQLVFFNNTLFPTHFLSNMDVQGMVHIEYYGGSLISKVGLGKTIVSLYHILESCTNNIDRKRNDTFVSFIETCNYTFKRGKFQGKVCPLPIVSPESHLDTSITSSNLYCPKHKSTPFHDKRIIAFKNLNEFAIEHYIRHNKFKTNATLIVCPNQLCDQWLQEYYTKFVNDKRVLLIVTKEQYCNVSLGDILFADIIIISYQFLENKYYHQKFVKYFNEWTRNSLYNLHEITRTYECTKTLLESTELNLLHLFEWRAVYLDEVHEIQNHVKANALKYFIYNFKSTYKWNITGTPFANGIDSFLNLLSYTTSFHHELFSRSTIAESCSTNYLMTNGINGGLIDSTKQLFRINTRESVRNEYSGNTLDNTVKMLSFTQQEKNIYDGYLQGNHTKYSDFLIRLCCDSELYNGDNSTRELIRNCKTLDEIQYVLIDVNKKRMDDIEAKLIRAKKELEKSEALVLEHQGHDNENPHHENLKAIVSSLKRKITQLSSEHQSTLRTYTYLKSAIVDLAEHTEPCPVCLDAIEQNNLVITKCGHKFCWECISRTCSAQSSSRGEFKCPFCNTIILSNDVYLLSPKRPIHTDDTGDELDQIVSRVKSTKIGNIIYFLKHNIQLNDKIILFSQWDEMLHKVGRYLQTYGINIVYCNGTVYQRKRAIQDFCSKTEIKVIMLSSRNAASGINLTVANKIILLEPVYGSKDYRDDIESQAIGRADRIGQQSTIQIIRFVIENTIEEDILKNNFEEDKLKQLVI